MDKIIRLTEADLTQIIKHAINGLLREEGEAASPGATSASADRVGAFDVPFGQVQRRDVYNPKAKSNISMNDALKRHDGKNNSISIPKEKK